MKLTVVDFVYILKLSLLLRGIFASSLDDEECIESEDSDYTGENSVIRRTSNKGYTETATSIVYIYSPQTSFNSLMDVGHPSTILIASTHIEVVTITPGLVDSKEPYTAESGTVVAQTVPNEDSSKITTICSSCSTSTNNNPNSNKETTESTLSKPDSSNSAVTSHGSTIAASSAGIASIHSEPSNSTSYNTMSTKKTSIIDQNYSCGTDICLSSNFTNTTTRNVRTLSSASQKLTSSQNGNTESSTKDKNNKTAQAQSSSTSTSVGTTSYHYFDSAGHQKILNFPFFLALLLIDYISF